MGPGSSAGTTEGHQRTRPRADARACFAQPASGRDDAEVVQATHDLEPGEDAERAVQGGVDGIVHVLRSILAEADLIMAVDGYPTLKDLTPDTLRRVT